MPSQLDRLLSQLVNLHPKYIDLSLGRLFNLLKKLENPHLKLPPVIHIAGTNGKGSTLKYLQNIIMENGLSAHAYISPHLNLFNERITIANKEIEIKKLLKMLQYVKKINNNKPITFFEITTATAFCLFSQVKADFLILETGLGGRLDATNVIKKSLINIITPIGIDHQEFLGKKIIDITNEKLGIIKKGSSIIFSKQKNIIQSHIKQKLKKNKNKKLFYKEDYKIITKNKKSFILEFNKKKYEFLKPKLLGDHQIENASTAISTILRLNEIGYSFSEKNINSGITKTYWPGRLEKGEIKKIKVYLDGAHNIDGAKQLLKYFKKNNLKLWLVIGMINNKNLYGFIKTLKPILKGVIAVPIPGEKNCFDNKKIQEVCDKLQIKNYSKLSITKADNFLVNKIKPKPKQILISGSLYLIGKIRNRYL